MKGLSMQNNLLPLENLLSSTIRITRSKKRNMTGMLKKNHFFLSTSKP